MGEAGTGLTGVRWDIARMVEDLDRDYEAIRLTTIVNLSDHLPTIQEALPVIRRAFQDRAVRVRDRALTACVRLVNRTEQDVIVAVCEPMLEQDPADVAALHVLLYLYAKKRYGPDDYRVARHALILRVIESMPDAPRSLMDPMKLDPESDGGVFEQAKRLWLKQVETHPDNTRVIENASVFFRGVDDVIAGRLIRRCQELEPENPRWSHQLGMLYSFQGDPVQPDSYKDWARMSLAQLEDSWKADGEPQQRFVTLLRMSDVALQAGEFDKARDYAEELLAEGLVQEHPGCRVWADRQANMVMGRLALTRNDLAEAKERLFGARSPDDSFLINAFCFMDPLMKLVYLLLDKGHRDVVLEYLRRESERAPGFADRLARWAGEIEHGRKPDFGDRGLLVQNLTAKEWRGRPRAMASRQDLLHAVEAALGHGKVNGFDES